MHLSLEQTAAVIPSPLKARRYVSAMVWLGSTSLLLVNVAPVDLVWHDASGSTLNEERLVARPGCGWSVASSGHWSQRTLSPHLSRALFALLTCVSFSSTLRFAKLMIAKMPGRLRAIIASALTMLQLSSAKPANPIITAPAVRPRQNSDTFVGYVELNNTCKSAPDPLRASLTMPKGAVLTVSPVIPNFIQI